MPGRLLGSRRLRAAAECERGQLRVRTWLGGRRLRLPGLRRRLRRQRPLRRRRRVRVPRGVGRRPLHRGCVPGRRLAAPRRVVGGGGGGGGCGEGRAGVRAARQVRAQVARLRVRGAVGGGRLPPQALPEELQRPRRLRRRDAGRLPVRSVLRGRRVPDVHAVRVGLLRPRPLPLRRPLHVRRRLGRRRLRAQDVRPDGVRGARPLRRRAVRVRGGRHGGGVPRRARRQALHARVQRPRQVRRRRQVRVRRGWSGGWCQLRKCAADCATACAPPTARARATAAGRRWRRAGRARRRPASATARATARACSRRAPAPSPSASACAGGRGPTARPRATRRSTRWSRPTRRGG